MGFQRIGFIAAALCVSCIGVHAAVPFIAGPGFSTGPEPWGVVIGDFNNDGNPDVAMANFITPGYATVLLGNGQGSFTFRSSPIVEKTSTGIAAGDFDGDGNLDLVVSSISNDPSDTVSVLLGRGDGTFDAVEYPVGAFPQFVAVSDLNGDGAPDIVTENSNGDSISVLLGNGDGTFMDRVDDNLGLSPTNLMVADMNGDGIPDVVVAANSFFASFAVLRGTGDGTFASPTYGGNGAAIYSGIAVADINRDGLPDVVLLDRADSRIDVYFALGQGLFANVVSIPTDADVSSVAAADLFGDDHMELVSAGGSGARLFEYRDDGTFHDAGLLPGVVGGAAIAISDINHDGKLDIVAPSYSNVQSTALINQTLFRSGFE